MLSQDSNRQHDWRILHHDQLNYVKTQPQKYELLIETNMSLLSILYSQRGSP